VSDTERDVRCPPHHLGVAIVRTCGELAKLLAAVEGAFEMWGTRA
jgi:hypothetical protein